LAPYDPTRQVLADAILPPSSSHWLGTDEFGRDVLSRLIYGARASLSVGIVSVLLASVIGITIGQIAGYRGGLFDSILMRVMDALLSFPGLMLALIINSVLGSSLNNAIIAIAIVSIPTFARLARGETLSIRERDFVQAARALGASHNRILLRHTLPNILSPLLVHASNLVAAAIIVEGGLSFLGLGVQPPTPSWGSMLRSGYSYISTSPWLVLGPLFAIMITVLGFNLLSDTLQTLLDPSQRNRGAR
jgi:peptide/nickel transport system permease protein